MVLNLLNVYHPKFEEKLDLKTIVSRHVTMKVFGNPIFQEKLDLIDLNLKCTENKEILIESKVWVSFIWASCKSSEFVKLYTDMSFLKIPFIAEIPDNESIQKKLEKFWQIKTFETKTTLCVKYLVMIFFLMKTNQCIKSDYLLKRTTTYFRLKILKKVVFQYKFIRCL